MNGQKARGFYDMSEDEIRQMVWAHLRVEESVITEFSSWAASLHLFLCYAQSMPAQYNVHIAVLDRQLLDDEVLIWHVPHLVGQFEDEYLAHDCIGGKGYTAIPFKKLVDHGLYNIFPELQSYKASSKYAMGRELRYAMFKRPAVKTWDCEIVVARDIGALFGKLSLPIMVALLCLRPREPMKDTKQSRVRTAGRFITGLNIEKIDPNLASEYWLLSGAVYTVGGFTQLSYRQIPDVKQWIELLSVISRYPPSQKRKRDEKEVFTRTYDLRPLPGRTRGSQQAQASEHPPPPAKKARYDQDTANTSLSLPRDPCICLEEYISR